MFPLSGSKYGKHGVALTPPLACAHTKVKQLQQQVQQFQQQEMQVVREPEYIETLVEVHPKIEIRAVQKTRMITKMVEEVRTHSSYLCACLIVATQ